MRALERHGPARPRARGAAEPREVRRRLERGEGLTAPELSVLLAYTKIVLADELLATDLPDDPFLRTRPVRLLPDRRCARSYRERRWRTHPLRREIIVTQVVNDLVNGAGMTFLPPAVGRDRRRPRTS